MIKERLVIITELKSLSRWMLSKAQEEKVASESVRPLK